MSQPRYLGKRAGAAYPTFGVFSGPDRAIWQTDGSMSSFRRPVFRAANDEGDRHVPMHRGEVRVLSGRARF